MCSSSSDFVAEVAVVKCYRSKSCGGGGGGGGGGGDGGGGGGGGDGSVVVLDASSMSSKRQRMASVAMRSSRIHPQPAPNREQNPKP